jgi:hypothetical protein
LNFGFSNLFCNGKVCELGPHFVDHGLGVVHGGPAWRRGHETIGERPGRRSGLPVVTGGGREGKGRCGGVATGLMGGRGATELPVDSGEVGGGGALRGHVPMWEMMREGREWCRTLQGRGAIL